MLQAALFRVAFFVNDKWLVRRSEAKEDEWAIVNSLPAET